MKNSHNVRYVDNTFAKTATRSVTQQSWHALSFEAVKDSLQTDVARGLTQSEAARRLAQYGPNRLSQARERSAFSILFGQFSSLIVALLVAATVIAFAMGENIEGFAILVVIALNAAIGFFTECKAEQALSALKNSQCGSPMSSGTVKKVRFLRPSWCQAISSYLQPERGCPPMAGSSRALACKSRRRH